MKTSDAHTGYSLAVIFVVLSAGRDFGIKLIGPTGPTFFLIMAAFLPPVVATGIYSLLSGRLQTLWLDRGAARVALVLNVTTLINWLAFLRAVNLIDADVCAAIVVGAMPFFMLLLGWRLDGRIVRRRDLAATACVAAGIGVIVWDRGLLTVGVAGGISLALIASFFAAANNWLVCHLKTGFGVGALPAFAVRFWILLAVAAGIGVSVKFVGIPASASLWMYAFTIGCVGIAIPIFCFQSAITRLRDAYVPTLLTTLCPACVVALQAGSFLLTGRPPLPGWVGVCGHGVVVAGLIWAITSPRTYRASATASSEIPG